MPLGVEASPDDIPFGMSSVPQPMIRSRKYVVDLATVYSQYLQNAMLDSGNEDRMKEADGVVCEIHPELLHSFYNNVKTNKRELPPPPVSDSLLRPPKQNRSTIYLGVKRDGSGDGQGSYNGFVDPDESHDNGDPDESHGDGDDDDGGSTSEPSRKKQKRGASAKYGTSTQSAMPNSILSATLEESKMPSVEEIGQSLFYQTEDVFNAAGFDIEPLAKVSGTVYEYQRQLRDRHISWNFGKNILKEGNPFSQDGLLPCQVCGVTPPPPPSLSPFFFISIPNNSQQFPIIPVSIFIYLFLSFFFSFQTLVSFFFYVCQLFHLFLIWFGVCVCTDVSPNKNFSSVQGLG